MRTAEEIKNGLEHCRNDAPCVECPYYDKRNRRYACEDELLDNALTYIQKLEVELEQSENKLAELLSYVTGGRCSKVTYTIDAMKRFADDYLQSTSEC